MIADLWGFYPDAVNFFIDSVLSSACLHLSVFKGIRVEMTNHNLILCVLLPGDSAYIRFFSWFINGFDTCSVFIEDIGIVLENIRSFWNFFHPDTAKHLSIFFEAVGVLSVVSHCSAVFGES